MTVSMLAALPNKYSLPPFQLHELGVHLSWQMDSVAGTSWTICIKAPVSSWSEMWKSVIQKYRNTIIQHVRLIRFAICTKYIFPSGPKRLNLALCQTLPTTFVPIGHSLGGPSLSSLRRKFLSDSVFVFLSFSLPVFLYTTLVPEGKLDSEGSQLWCQGEPPLLLWSPCCSK